MLAIDKNDILFCESWIAARLDGTRLRDRAVLRHRIYRAMIAGNYDAMLLWVREGMRVGHAYPEPGIHTRAGDALNSADVRVLQFWYYLSTLSGTSISVNAMDIAYTVTSNTVATIKWAWSRVPSGILDLKKAFVEGKPEPFCFSSQAMMALWDEIQTAHKINSFKDAEAAGRSTYVHKLKNGTFKAYPTSHATVEEGEHEHMNGPEDDDEEWDSDIEYDSDGNPIDMFDSDGNPVTSALGKVVQSATGCSNICLSIQLTRDSEPKTSSCREFPIH
ncbi:hypothetical protein BC828DRAFT_227530 [Blastocladiella britannica]|nr:hypothetical protein BC828DRAFT_227530 [Blastocladiella britannica]